MDCFLAPAKINLRLKIVGRRSDGYHLLESLFAPIDIYDEIHIRKSQATRVTYTIPSPSHPEPSPCHPERSEGPQHLHFENCLITKAKNLFDKTFKTEGHIEVHVKKTIPWGAGLGGGSSDAAVVLKWLSQTHNVDLSSPEFSDVCQKVGSDVPFFIGGKSAWVTGVGEKVQAVQLPNFYVVVIKPNFSVPTPHAYKWYTENTKTHAIPDQRLIPQSFARLCNFVDNDLQGPVSLHYPQINGICRKLLDFGSKKAAMTGSGSAVFGLFESRSSAEETCRRLLSEEPREFSAYLGKVL